MPGFISDSGGGLFSNLLKIGTGIYLGNTLGKAFGMGDTAKNALGGAVTSSMQPKQPQAVGTQPQPQQTPQPTTYQPQANKDFPFMQNFGQPTNQMTNVQQPYQFNMQPTTFSSFFNGGGY